MVSIPHDRPQGHRGGCRICAQLAGLLRPPGARTLRTALADTVKSRLDRVLERRGQARTRLAPAADVARTLARLHPRDVGRPLIRLGGEGDGGYLVPDDLDGITACFSPGVSDVAHFESDLALRTGARCFLADASVDAPPIDHPLFEFDHKFLGSGPGDPFIGLPDWVAQKVGAQSEARPGARSDSGALLLQMDIEGAEYDVLLATPADVLRRFRIIVLELHGLDDVFLAPGQLLIETLLRHLTAAHVPVHVHPNNCCGTVTRNGLTVPRVIEVTLLRADRCGAARPAQRFPHPLDRPNLPNRADLVLPPALYAAQATGGAGDSGGTRAC